MIDKKGQAILELATFGSVVLFCLALLIHFGLQMNYQQNVQMQAFRKALKLAYYKQGPNSQANLTILKDKPVVDPRDKWGFADRVSVGAGGSVTWSNTLQGVYVNDISETVDDRDLPRIYIEVNKKTDADKAQIKDGRGLADSEINDTFERDRVGTRGKGVFKTGDFRWIGGLESYLAIGTYLEDSEHKYGPRDYYPLALRAQDIKVFEDEKDPQQKVAFFMFAGLKRTLTNVVLISNADQLSKFRNGTLGGSEVRGVNIAAVKGTYGRCDKDKYYYCGTLVEILSIDPRRGEIDAYHVDVKPWDKDKSLENRQGLLSDYVKEMNYGSGAKITVTETPRGISTRTDSAAIQRVTHKIRLNNGTVVDIPVEFKPVGTYNYEVKHE